MFHVKVVYFSMILSALSVAVDGQTSSLRSPPSDVNSATQPLFPTCSSGQPGTITVSGRGLATATADVADVSLSISITNETATGARDIAAQYVNNVFTAVKQINGVQPENVTTTSISVYPKTKYNSGDGTSTIIGYTYTNYINILLGNLTGDLLSNVLDTAVRNGGNNLTISRVSFSLSPQLSYSKTVEARSQAVADTKTTVQQYSEDFSVTLGPLLEVVDTSTSSTPVQNYDTSGYARSNSLADTSTASAATPVAIGKEQVSAQLTAVFTICGKS